MSVAVDSGDPQAVALAREAVALRPDDADANRLLGQALLVEGDLAGATAAFQAVVRLDPGDTASVVALGHLTHRQGGESDAVRLFEQAAAADPDDVGVLHTLVDLHRIAGRSRQAVAWAERWTQRAPDDALGLLLLAELYLTVNEYDAARQTFATLREADAEPGHAIVALHGMIEAELRAGRRRPALDLAVTATGIDRNQLTSDLLAHVVAQVFGDGDRPAPSADEVYQALARERLEHRQELEEAVIG